MSQFEDIWREVRLHSPSVPGELCQHWVRDRFHNVAYYRMWSWNMGMGQFNIPSFYNTGTVTLTADSMVVTGDATTVWDISMVGRQIKAKNFIFTITDVTAVNSLTIDRIWPQATIADAPYTILQAYLTVPNDFRMFYTVIDPRNNWRIWTNYTSRDINNYDPARMSTGNPCILAAVFWSSEDFATSRPMYELWPHQTVKSGYPYVYYKAPPDFDETHDLPYNVHDHMLKKGALADLCKWPGTPEHPNPMFNLNLAMVYEKEWQAELDELERNDQEIYMTTLWYHHTDMPYAPLDARFYQTHAV